MSLSGGFIGAFNGFATYPVAIPGLADLGFTGLQAATSYLVYFSWTLPFNSLFIAPNISSVASRVPVEDIVKVAGLLSIPLVYLSTLAFLRTLGFPFFERRSQALFWIVGTGNALGIVLFTQVWTAYYILMLIAGGVFTLAGLYVYGRTATRHTLAQAQAAGGTSAPAAEAIPDQSFGGGMRFRAYAPLMLGVLLVLVTRAPGMEERLSFLRFTLAAWGKPSINVSIVTSAGFYILVTALVCYFFRVRNASPKLDLITATHRGRHALATLAVGSAMVYLLVDTGQIALLGDVIARGGTYVYAGLYPGVAFLGGMAFGQGLPANFLFSRMQVPMEDVLGIPLMVLVGIMVVVTMGPPNALKPTQIAYSAGLANIKGRDGEIFRTCLPWQLLQIAVTALCAVILVLLWK